MPPLALEVSLSDSYDEAVEKVIDALKSEGFGILTRIDVDATLKEKLDVEFRPYVILGACNPPLAHRALQNEARVGVMLPCNVTVEQRENDVLVAIANPDTMMRMPPLDQSAGLIEVAAEAKAKLERVVQKLEA
ncbi:MAG: DUF302 domain-containing protein [Chloroflexi bacterium]|nr:DUF302 domain-containing protein [Chloroflexota bacterium]